MPEAEDLRSSAVENFLKAVYKLQQDQERVRTSAIAEALGITAPSAHDFINRCTEAGLLDYITRRGVRLTDQGKKIALQVLRKHRLLELYLVRHLGYSWDEVHEEAERLEHHISDKLAARMDEVLGQPDFDPHGDPIPAADGSLPASGLLQLSALSLGQRGQIRRLLDQTPEDLRYLQSKGLILGAEVAVLAHDPYENLTHVQVEAAPQVIGAKTARAVLVQLLLGD
jgi:DtxR family Mn-dependent transcriptional regulator